MLKDVYVIFSFYTNIVSKLKLRNSRI
jgi:hypothetical protein